MGLKEKFKILIIDDEMPEHKGYDGIEDRFPDTFEIDRCNSYNSTAFPPEDRSIELLRTKKYDLILLDYVLREQQQIKTKRHGITTEKSFSVYQPEQGDHILAQLRSGLREYPDIPTEEGNLNRDTYVLGVSEEWRRNDEDGWVGMTRKPIANFSYVNGREPEELFEALSSLLKQISS